jgi:hypothetical protein
MTFYSLSDALPSGGWQAQFPVAVSFVSSWQSHLSGLAVSYDQKTYRPHIPMLSQM